MLVWLMGECVAARSRRIDAVRSSMCLSGCSMWSLCALVNCLWAALAVRLMRVLSVNMSVSGGGGVFAPHRPENSFEFLCLGDPGGEAVDAFGMHLIG
jgi:hypothetical protein